MRNSTSFVCAVAFAACLFAVDASAQGHGGGGHAGGGGARSAPSAGRAPAGGGAVVRSGTAVVRSGSAPVGGHYVVAPGHGTYYGHPYYPSYGHPYYPYYRYPYYGYGYYPYLSFGVGFSFGYPYYAYAYPYYSYPYYAYPPAYPTTAYPYAAATPAPAPAEPAETITVSPNNVGEVRVVGAPSDAQIYADDQLLGTVADFAGPDRPLLLAAGPHHIEVRIGGGAPLTYDVTIKAGQRLMLQAAIR
jgi:hypothetical protein